MSRKPIGRLTRFEVFKRDSFACQYCGGKAPDVVLVVDHIKPVADGGDNHLMNLITACQPCNSGKGARKLGDDAVITKQLEQLEDLNDRRIQLEMLMEWRNELLSLDGLKVEKYETIINSKDQKFVVSAIGREKLADWGRKFTFEEMLEAIDKSFELYFDGTAESWAKAFATIPGCVAIRRVATKKPYLPRLFYIRGILRNRGYVNEHDVMEILEDAARAGVDVEDMGQFAKRVRSWTAFNNEVRCATEEALQS